MMRVVLFFIFFSFSIVAGAQPDTTQKIISGRKNSIEQQQKPYVILISADGFRHDYADKHNAENLKAFGREGIHGSLIPPFPSLTFPSHYSIATGLYPSHHGLVDNTYYDRERKEMYATWDRKIVQDGKRYGGTPLWVMAEKHQMLTAHFYWVGTEADIQGVTPTYHYRYNEDLSIDRKIQIVIEWLNLPADQRPHLITFYLSEVDHNGHQYGPDAPQTATAVRFVDSSIKKLVKGVAATGLPVNYIFVADHGMTNVDTTNAIDLTPLIDTSLYIHNRGSQVLQIYAKDKKDVKPLYKVLKRKSNGYDVYLRKKVKSSLVFNKKNDRYNRIGDIVVLPHWPLIFTYPGKRKNPGAHGFDPAIRDMHSVFIAWGPAFKNGLNSPAFQNVDVYPLVSEILGLKIQGKIDGSRKLTEMILK